MYRYICHAYENRKTACEENIVPTACRKYWIILNVVDLYRSVLMTDKANFNGSRKYFSMFVRCKSAL